MPSLRVVLLNDVLGYKFGIRNVLTQPLVYVSNGRIAQFLLHFRTCWRARFLTGNAVVGRKVFFQEVLRAIENIVEETVARALKNSTLGSCSYRCELHFSDTLKICSGKGWARNWVSILAGESWNVEHHRGKITLPERSAKK